MLYASLSSAPFDSSFGRRGKRGSAPNTNKVHARPEGLVLPCRSSPLLLVVEHTAQRYEGYQLLDCCKFGGRIRGTSRRRPRHCGSRHLKSDLWFQHDASKLFHSIDWNCLPWSTETASGYLTYGENQIRIKNSHRCSVDSAWRKQAALNLVSLSAIWRTEIPLSFIRSRQKVLLNTVFFRKRNTKSVWGIAFPVPKITSERYLL